jgi:hypothetical protein
MQRPIEYNQGFMNFNLPKYELMTPDKFEKYVKQSFNLEPQSEAEAEPQVQYQTQPQTQTQTQTQPQPLFPRDLFGQIKPATQLSQPTQLTHFTNPKQPIHPACIGATGPTQSNISFGDAMTNLKKEKAKNDIIESLYVELSSIRSQIELLTKTTDNIYRIINKL